MKLIRNIESGEVFHATTASSKDLVAGEDYEFVEHGEVELDKVYDVDGHDEAEAEESPDFGSLKKAELVELAEKRGIDHDKKATKDDLIELLEADEA